MSGAQVWNRNCGLFDGRLLTFDIRRLGCENMSGYKDLAIYQRAYENALIMHKLTNTLPKHETYELSSQMRRAAISIPLNIAEGYGRKIHQNDFKNFLVVALGSCNEVNVLLDMISDLSYIANDEYVKLKDSYDHLGRQITKFIQAMN